MGLWVMGWVAWLGLAQADVFVGELKKSKCTRVAGKEFMAYVRQAMGDRKLEVIYDENGACGRSLYVTKLSSRRRWAVFPEQNGCQCYLNTARMLERNK